ncbi:anti-sigma factor [Nocardioides sp. GY 10113]|uniref:anti-sigma factor n=1 Tax=Nocardioides sp. GY 10113 TaxID=2569761 RepID=UPI0010A87B08|nr:anti-sigma factor [Nocardioides sp. GY 10113]TIC89057.1 anti-sigma factor [Nocardioides sp. GY 10113]
MSDPINIADLHALTGAYAVDALDEVERAVFEDHLDLCPECRVEVAELAATAALLATEPVSPPPAVRDAVLDGIETIRPLPPRTTPTGPAAPSVPASGYAGVPGVPGVPGTSGAPTSDEGGARVIRFPRPSFRTLLVAASVVLLLLVAGLTWRPWQDAVAPPVPSATERVLEAEDATRVSQEFPDGSTATIVLSREEGRAVIVTTDMAAAPDGKVFEVWLQTPAGDMQPAALMPDEPNATVLLDGDASEATGVGITVEPEGGSPEPTSDPIALFELEA